MRGKGTPKRNILKVDRYLSDCVADEWRPDFII